MSTDTFESVKTMLQRSKQVGAVKTDLFAHVTEIINRIVGHHKYDAYQKFEEISMLIKKTQLKIKNPRPLKEIQELDQQSANAELDRYVCELRALLCDKLVVDKHDSQYVDKKHQ